MKYINKYVFKIGYNVFLIKVLKSGILCKIGVLYEGKIFILLLVVEGKNIIMLVIMLVLKENLYFLEIFVWFY